MAANFNAKYKGSGALFQGPYRARIVDNDRHLQYLSVYINIKNVFEAYPGGLKTAAKQNLMMHMIGQSSILFQARLISQVNGDRRLLITQHVNLCSRHLQILELLPKRLWQLSFDIDSTLQDRPRRITNHSHVHTWYAQQTGEDSGILL